MAYISAGGCSPPIFRQAVISRLQRLQTSMQTISAAEVNALYDYLNGADGVRTPTFLCYTNFKPCYLFQIYILVALEAS
jgi:hypothetical protein